MTRAAQHEALATALMEQLKQSGMDKDTQALLFVSNAAEGIYQHGNPIDPKHIGMTDDEFTTLRLLIYT